MSAPAHRLDSVMEGVDEPIARIYAEALLGQVPSNVEADEVGAELEALVALLDRVDGFEELLTGWLLGHRQRCEAVERIFRGRASEPLEALLNVMAEAGRLGLLRAVSRSYRSALHRRQGKREVTVVSAAELDEAQRRAVTAALSQAMGAEAVMAFRVDEHLVGGMLLQVGDLVYDASVRAGLARLQERLRKDILLSAAPAPGGPTRPRRPEVNAPRQKKP